MDASLLLRTVSLRAKGRPPNSARAASTASSGSYSSCTPSEYFFSACHPPCSIHVIKVDCNLLGLTANSVINRDFGRCIYVVLKSIDRTLLSATPARYLPNISIALRTRASGQSTGRGRMPLRSMMKSGAGRFAATLSAISFSESSLSMSCMFSMNAPSSLASGSEFLPVVRATAQ